MGCGPGRRGRMLRKASLRNDIGIYILKDEQGWLDKRKRNGDRKSRFRKKKLGVKAWEGEKPSVFIKL